MIFDSLEGLVRILFRCDIYERLYTKRKLQATEQLNTSLVKLYVAVLKYLCSARRQLSLTTAGERSAKNLGCVDTNYLFSPNAPKRSFRHGGVVQEYPRV